MQIRLAPYKSKAFVRATELRSAYGSTGTLFRLRFAGEAVHHKSYGFVRATEVRAQNRSFCEACKLDPPGLPSEARLRFAGEAVLTKALLLYGASLICLQNRRFCMARFAATSCSGFAKATLLPCPVKLALE